jgi:arginyl-tRNA synthetase
MNIRDILQGVVAKASGWPLEDIKIEKPKNGQADYALGVFSLAKAQGKSPNEIAAELADKIMADKPNELEKVEASGGYVNFFFTQEHVQKLLVKINSTESFQKDSTLEGKTIMVEYTDPNPFKLFHIGHLMSNTIGEVIARLNEASGAKVLRVNYQGDKGLHVAKAIWAMKQKNMSQDSAMDKIAEAYAFGSKSYEDQEEENKVKFEVEEINKKIYDSSDKEINELYQKGRETSLEYFEEEYKRLGTKFDHYFFESEVADDGLRIIKAHPDIFVEGDNGAIVFKGEDHGLHTRVFVNSKGLPTYEAKELGVNKKKFDEYHPDLSVIVTANEINEYFKVLLKVMSLVLPEVAEKTKHIGHGVMRLPSGKMSSRTGDVVTTDSLIDKSKEILKEKESGDRELDAETREAVAVGAIKYSILKQSPGKDIIFDFDASLAVKGDSGPYLQYTYARLKAILTKAGERVNEKPDVAQLVDPSELALIKHFLELPNTIREATEMIAPQRIALYAFELANLVNTFYEKIRILDDENPSRVAARLLLVRTAASMLQRSLSILGIKTPERI